VKRIRCVRCEGWKYKLFSSHGSDVNKANSVKAKVKAKAKQYEAKASHSKAKVKASHKIKLCGLHTVIIISVNSYYCQLHGKVYCKSMNCISESVSNSSSDILAL